MSKSSRADIVKVARWSGRILALLLFLFWGGFFVEHTMEWFLGPFPRTPPPKIWFGHALHGAMLVSLLLLWRWPLAGTVLLGASALAFFGPRAGDRFPLFFVVTMVPAVLILLSSWRLHQPRTTEQTQNPVA